MSFLTSAANIKQTPKRGKYKLCNNELFQDKDKTIYLAWRGFITDNFTWLKTNKWDIRCSHIHDVGCQYHQLVKVNLTQDELLIKKLLVYVKQTDSWYCKDIPIEYLQVVDISKFEINNLFYRMLSYADCPKMPKFLQVLYRIGVAFNLHWFFTGKESINLSKIYS